MFIQNKPEKIILEGLIEYKNALIPFRSAKKNKEKGGNEEKYI